MKNPEYVKLVAIVEPMKEKCEYLQKLYNLHFVMKCGNTDCVIANL